jgi:hypothetical protein
MAGELNIEKPIIKTPESVSVKIEKPLSPEIKSEVVLPKIEKIKEAAKTQEKISGGSIPVSSQSQTWQKKRADEIDGILSEGLNDVFLKMNPTQQKVFKKTGEETVTKINQLLQETKVKVNKIIELIRQWLKLIPGVNIFFLEQEVKIKTDKIMKIKNKF